MKLRRFIKKDYWDRAKTDSLPERLQEIYFDDQIVYPDNGYPLCDMEFAQRNPSIIRFGSNTDNYLTFWEDLRSTGKEELVNLYGQSINFEPLNIDINELSPHSFKIQNIY